MQILIWQLGTPSISHDQPDSGAPLPTNDASIPATAGAPRGTPCNDVIEESPGLQSPAPPSPPPGADDRLPDDVILVAVRGRRAAGAGVR